MHGEYSVTVTIGNPTYGPRPQDGDAELLYPQN